MLWGLVGGTLQPSSRTGNTMEAEASETSSPSPTLFSTPLGHPSRGKTLAPLQVPVTQRPSRWDPRPGARELTPTRGGTWPQMAFTKAITNNRSQPGAGEPSGATNSSWGTSLPGGGMTTV